MLAGTALAASLAGLMTRSAHAEELPLLNPDAAPESESTATLTDTATPPATEPPAEAAPKSCAACRHALGGQALWIAGKFAPELAARYDPNRWFWIELELGLVFLLDPPAGEDRVVLGSPFAVHFVFVPYRSKTFDVGLGVGPDLHLLYGIGKGIVEAALETEVVGHAWVTPRLGLFGSARVYPLATEGLGLGEKRDGSRGLPVLFATGVECGFP